MKEIHSLLFVPAKEKYLDICKLNQTCADALIFDLEDSIDENAKDDALNLLSIFLQNIQIIPSCFIRLNADRLERELKVFCECANIRGYMIPKTEDSERLNMYSPFFESKDIIALLETPLGLLNIESIVSQDFITAVAFGAEDYTCLSNMENRTDVIYYARSRICMYAKAYGKKAYDTPSFNYSDLEELEKEARSVADMGFDGKLAINPKQIDVLNKVFKYYDYDYMEYIVSTYEKKGEAVAIIDGKIYERPHIKHLKTILGMKER